MPTQNNTKTVKKAETVQKQNSVVPFTVTINRLLNPEKSNVKAIASLSIGSSFAVHGLKVISGAKGDFVAMPSTKAPDGSYNETFHPISAEARTQMMDAVLAAYENKLAEQQEQSDEQEVSRTEPTQTEQTGMGMR